MKSIGAQAIARAQRFAVLQLSGVALLVPLTEVYSAESVLDVDTRRTVSGSVGAVPAGGDWFPVFCLSDHLELTRALPETFRVCAILASANISLALACRSVSSLDSSALEHHPLPECMRTKGSPVRALAYDGNRVLCHTSLSGLMPILEAAA